MSAAGRKPRGEGYYVVAGGRVWGPYGRERIDGFVAEGRVAASTPVGDNPEGPFQAASRHPSLSALFGRPASAPVEAQPAIAAQRALIVWAELSAPELESFEQMLGAHGPMAALGPGLWLVRARLGASALRNALTRRLSREDSLLVIEAPLEQAAWFNLAGGDEPALRRLWLSGEVEC